MDLYLLKYLENIVYYFFLSEYYITIQYINENFGCSNVMS